VRERVEEEDPEVPSVLVIEAAVCDAVGELAIVAAEEEPLAVAVHKCLCLLDRVWLFVFDGQP
jgi:hypothetical protein